VSWLRKGRIRLGVGTAWFAVLLSNLVFWQLPPEAAAQASGQGQMKPKRKSQIQSAKVGQEPELPYLPKYPSKWKRYRGGMVGNGVTDGGFYHLRYDTAENPDDVLTWYEGALKGMGFNISERAATRLAAVKPDVNTSIFVMVQPSWQPGYDPRFRTHYIVRYSQDPARPLWKPPENKGQEGQDQKGQPGQQ